MTGLSGLAPRDHPHRPIPRETLERCALRAQLRGDPMIGTAFPAARLLLVEQPGAWGPRGLIQSDFDPTAAETLETSMRAAGVRVQLLRRPGRTPRGSLRAWAYADARAGRRTLRWGTFVEDADLLSLSVTPDGLDGLPSTPDERPVYLVCAHSKHDACCALRGRPVAAAMAQARPGRVWESSHVGGDRFAANVLVLPSGLMYGRMLPFAAEGFAAAAEAGEVIPELLRGQIGVPPLGQAGLGYAFQQLGLRRQDDVRFLGLDKPVDGIAVVHLETARARYDVPIKIVRRPARGLTCAHPQETYFFGYEALELNLVG